MDGEAPVSSIRTDLLRIVEEHEELLATVTIQREEIACLRKQVSKSDLSKAAEEGLQEGGRALVAANPDWPDVAEWFDLLSNPLRLRIFRNLMVHKEGLKGVQLANNCESKQVYVSQQLTKLKAAGVVSETRHGTSKLFVLNYTNPVCAALVRVLGVVKSMAAGTVPLKVVSKKLVPVNKG